MSELKRESSFERVLSNLERSYSTDFETLASRNEASRTISTWLKKNNKLRNVYKSIKSDDMQTIDNTIECLNQLDGKSFDKAQEILADESFVHSLANFLNSLPSDPSLKKRNKMARSVRIICSSFLISKYPGFVMEDDGKPDNCLEAQQCHDAAKLYMLSLQRFSRTLQKSTCSLSAFRSCLIGYRFTLRNFLVSIDAWRKVDKDRLKHAFEIAYCESYMVIWTSQKMLGKVSEKLAISTENERASLERERDENVSFIESGNARIAQYREMLIKLLGPHEGKDLLDELDAYLHSSTEGMGFEVDVGHGNVPPHINSSLHQSPTADSLESTSLLPSSSPAVIKLKKVSAMTNIGTNQLLHELCLNPSFHISDPLPPLPAFDSERDRYAPTPLSASDAAVVDVVQRDLSQGKEILKEIMMNSIDDRLIANLLVSAVSSTAEVVVGNTYQVWYGSEIPDSSNGAFMHAQVLDLTSNSEFMDCKYVADGIVEKNVPLCRIKLSSHRRDPIRSGFLSILQDIVGRISALIPTRSDVHARLRSAIDLDLLQQMFVNDAMGVGDLMKVFSTLVSVITQLQSPLRAEELLRWFDQFALHCQSCEKIDDALLFLPKFFRVASERLEQIQVEIANYYLAELAPFAKAEGPLVLKNTVDKKITEIIQEHPSAELRTTVENEYEKYLPRTANFLCNQFNDDAKSTNEYLKDNAALQPHEDLIDPQVIATLNSSRKSLSVALVARAFSNLLQQHVDLSSYPGNQLLPETFLWDGVRLRNLKNEIDSLVLVSTLLISFRSYLLSMKTRATLEQEVTFQDMLYEEMRDDTVSLTGVVTTAQNFVRKNVHMQVQSAEWEKELEESLKKCVSNKSPVFSLFLKRVHIILIKSLLDMPFTDLLTRFSMNSRPQLQQLKNVINLAKNLFVHNYNAFGEIYNNILRCRLQRDIVE